MSNTPHLKRGNDAAHQSTTADSHQVSDQNTAPLTSNTQVAKGASLALLKKQEDKLAEYIYMKTFSLIRMIGYFFLIVEFYTLARDRYGPISTRRRIIRFIGGAFCIISLLFNIPGTVRSIWDLYRLAGHISREADYFEKGENPEFTMSEYKEIQQLMQERTEEILRKATVVRLELSTVFQGFMDIWRHEEV